MLTRVQCSRADDQRGLLTKEQLELPSFLQIPAEQSEGGEGKSEELNPESCSSKHKKAATEEKPCVNGKHKDSNGEKKKREQSVRTSSADGTTL